MCRPSDALSQHLLSYLGFSYLGHGVSLHGYSSKAQPLLLTLDEGYLLTATPPDLEHGVAPLGHCPDLEHQVKATEDLDVYEQFIIKILLFIYFLLESV